MGFESQRGQEIYFFSEMSRLALGVTLHPIHQEPQALSPGKTVYV